MNFPMEDRLQKTLENSVKLKYLSLKNLRNALKIIPTKR